GTRLDFRTFAGGTILTGAVENEDSDPDVIRLILEKLKSSSDSKTFTSLVNYQRKSTTFKWKSIRLTATALYRMGLAKSGLMWSLGIYSGTTPLNAAVMRGDVKVVKILLENDANPYVENDLGMNAFEICEKCGPFPSVMTALQKNSE
ncbi:ankyrin repeat domain-containing protein, partial [bacterium]|nr:ankyrin repeat domain-containing protein [bacterium]